MNGPFKVTTSVHGMPCVEVTGNVSHADHLAETVRASHMMSHAYTVRTKAGAFLQGYDRASGWALVEFWLPTYEEFVQFANATVPK